MKVSSPWLRLVLASALLLLQPEPRTRGADVTVYLAKKGLEYLQTDSNLPTINVTNGYGFIAEVDLAANNSVTNATVQPPAGLPAQTLTLSSSQSKLDFKHKYNTITALDNHYVDGAYGLTIYARNDGIKTAGLQVQGSLYPGGPHLQNFAAVQAVNANGYFGPHWDAFAGGTTSDFIQFRIQDLAGNKLFETPDFGKAGNYDGRASGAVVPPGTLPPGQTCEATLTFVKNVMTNATGYPGALGVGAYYSRNTFTLLTSAALPPDVKKIELSKAGKWVQTNSTSIIPQAANEYVFQASCEAYNTGVLTSGSVLLPPSGAISRPLVSQPDGVTIEFSDIASSAAALDAAYAAGQFQFVFPTPQDGNKFLTLSLPVDAFPAPPRISNFDELGSINVNRPFTVSWDPWIGGGVNDFIQVRVEDAQNNRLFSTPGLGNAGSLDGRVTSTEIPAAALPPSQALEIHVTFNKLIKADTDTYIGVLQLVDFQTRTKMSIQTFAAADATNYAIFKEQFFRQADPGLPVLQISNAFRLESRVLAATSNSVSGATVVTPLGASASLTRLSGGLEFLFTNAYATKSALDAAYPNGIFALRITGVNDGLQNLPLTLVVDGYPNPPHLTDLYAAQLVDSTRDFVCNWDPLVGAAGFDNVQCQIYDPALNLAFQTPGAGENEALDGFATSVVIPAFTLVPNRVYAGLLIFRKMSVVDTVSYPGAQGFGGYAAVTQFRLVTRGAGNPPLLSLTTLPASHQSQLSFPAVPGLAYRIEGSSNLAQWLPLNTNVSSGGTLQWTDSSRGASFFYRTMVMP